MYNHVKMIVILPHLIINLYDFLSAAEQRIRYLKKKTFLTKHTLDQNFSKYIFFICFAEGRKSYRF